MDFVLLLTVVQVHINPLKAWLFITKMKQFRLLMMILLSLTTSSTAVPMYAMRGCNDTCGKVRIPYPFGIGASCSINEWYNVDCNSSTPYLSKLNSLEVLSINLDNQTVTVNVSLMMSDCHNPVQKSSQISNIDLDGSPFLFSRSHNKFVMEGCGNAVLLDQGRVVTGCGTSCRNDTRLSSEIEISKCLGINCCRTTIPYNLKSYGMNLTGLERQVGAACGWAFLVDENSHVRSLAENISYVPISLLWTLTKLDSYLISCCTGTSTYKFQVDVGNGNSVTSYKCRNINDYNDFNYDYEGNPYIEYGCGVTDECQRCRSRGGGCFYDDESYENEDGIMVNTKRNMTCHSYSYDSYPYSDVPYRKISVRFILGISISMGVLFLVAISYALYKMIKKIKAKRRRNRFFKRNGGLLLKQQEEADPSFFDKTIHFTSRELEKATDYFNENRILGRRGQGTVYKGMLVDGRIVAVKKSKVVDESQLEQFINEVVVLSQVNHRNVVKLLGCCLETEVPLLVSEFIPNGTLYDRIHNVTDEFPISWNMRLQIATEVAGAVAYLHSATSVPIYHRDIKTTNILLDDKHRAKVSDFGTSRFVSMDQTHLTTLVKGTFGYLDPEYFQSSQFTEKSDVYSFGVVLVELLTGEVPISLTRFGENRSLATHFMLAMEEGRVMSIIDVMVIKEGTREEILVVANLAMRCLNLNGKNRPTMKEVVAELEAIRVSHVPSMVQTNFQQVVQAEELQMIRYGESTSTFMSVEDTFSQ